MRLIFLAALLLAGCASAPKVHGNDRGGMIDWFATNERAVFDAATKHCAQYRKQPRITQMQKEAGGSVLFECS